MVRPRPTIKALRNGDIPDALFSGLFVVMPGLIGVVFLAISLAIFLWFALGVATRVTTISPEGLRLRIGLGPIRFGGFTPFADIQSVTQSSAESSDEDVGHASSFPIIIGRIIGGGMVWSKCESATRSGD